MKSIRTIVAAVVVALGMVAVPAAQAQFRFGAKVGLNVNKLHFNKEITSSDNRAGFTGGVMAEFTVPVIGVGMDASVMYVRRNAKFMDQYQNVENVHNDYIDIPLNLKWKINVPVISSILRPFLTTGPSFAFLTSKKSFDEFRNKKCDVAWNFGFGAELLKHVQIGASYGLGLNKVTGNADSGIEGKNRYWTVTAAYLF